MLLNSNGKKYNMQHKCAIRYNDKNELRRNQSSPNCTYFHLLWIFLYNKSYNKRHSKLTASCTVNPYQNPTTNPQHLDKMMHSLLYDLLSRKSQQIEVVELGLTSWFFHEWRGKLYVWSARMTMVCASTTVVHFMIVVVTAVGSSTRLQTVQCLPCRPRTTLQQPDTSRHVPQT